MVSVLSVFGGPAHPRVGGENPVRFGAFGLFPGSSPRGRGKRVEARHVAEEMRLIPAWAGKTLHHTQTNHEDKAHPRVGGENLKSPPTPLRDPGSSPRGRGKLGEVNLAARRGRLIPAWAGKTG